ncbi:ABC transporter permease [Shewanella sp. NFH-SH190041]|uniref:ABC transporter permease n=1 Tax=Shewanella sp. NFH-SH190041 TaxID=2950245 RepID=UPI0021C47C04|nr:FtsX-like permease family protein [Shewanella sp. NFH-SH190041]BDM64739.1 ABC transporter permease [Shewanella sp. NFH-SH190041]
MSWTLALRLFRRELKQGQLLLIILAIALAVLSVSGLAGISERLQQAINGQAAKFIAADRIITSPQPLAPALLQQAESLGLQQVTGLEFNSMIYAGESFQLVTVRAVGPEYPLKGQIELNSGPVATLPAAGELWYEHRLAGLLGAAGGKPARVELGNAKMILGQEIRRLPDAGFNPFASSPVVLMRLADVAATGIISPGSRVTYRYQFAGSADALADFTKFAKPKLTQSQRWVDVQSGDSPIAGAVQRAERFLLLASLLGIALACAAIGIAAQRYCQRHYDVVAMLKTFGASSGQVTRIFALHLLLVSVSGIVSGLIGGRLLAMGISTLLPAEIAAYPTPLWRPVWLGISTGVLSAVMFSAYPLLRLLHIPPLRVLQRQLEGRAHWAGLHLLLSMTAIGALGWLYSGSLPLTLTVLAAALLLGMLLAGLGWLMIRLGHGIGMKTTNPLQLALAGLRRRARHNAVQLVGFSAALVLLLTILALRQDLLQEWQQQLPDNAPNYFLFNIAPQDEQPLADFLALAEVQATDIYPVVRARLIRINDDTTVSGQQAASGQEGRRGISRELNLTWRDSLPPNNDLLEGRFNQAKGEVSIETKVMERLDLKLGDHLTYMIDNRELTVRITSIRTVHWETLQPNFFMILTREDLADFDHTAMMSFHLPDNQRQLVVDLIKTFPTVAVIDVGAMVSQLRQIIDQVSLSLTLVLILVVLASALVMVAQTEAGMAMRQRELAVLRTFGGSGRLLRLATALEFALLGLIAGVLAAIVAEFSLYLLKTQVFELRVFFHWHWWLLAPVCGAVIVALLGLWRCRQLLSRSCVALLKGV